MGRTESPKRRSLATWVFRTVGITSLALGVGANSAIFSVTSSLWLRHRGILEPNAVGTVLFRPTVGTDGALMPSATMRECRVLESMASASVAFEVYARSADSRWMNPTVTLATGEHLRTTTVSHAYFIVLGVGLRGQGFQPEDDLSDRRVAVASQQFASTHFPSQTEVVGHTVATRQGDVTIIGVAPREFLGTRLGDATDLWIPLGALSTFSAAPEDARAFIPLAPIVRLRPSGSWRAVQTELDQLTQGRALAFSLASLQFVPTSLGAAGRQHQLVQVLLIMAIMVLMATVLNLSGLLMARMDSRRSEVAVRLALGASRTHIVKVFLRDAAELVGGGVLSSMAITYLVTQSIRHLRLPGGVAIRDLDLSVDWRVTAFAIVLAIIVVGVSAVWPMARLVATEPRDLLAQSALGGDRRVSQVRHVLLAAYVALSVILTAATASLATQISTLNAGGQGVDDRSLIITTVTPATDAYLAVSPEGAARVVADFRAAIEKARAVSGVEAVTYGDAPLPALGIVPPTRLSSGDSSITRPVLVARGGPGYLHTIGGTLVSGRDLSSSDLGPVLLNIVAGPPRKPARVGALIDQTLAQSLWPRGDALGSFVDVDGRPGLVVGVIRDVLSALPSRIRSNSVIIGSQPSGWLGSHLPAILVRSQKAAGTPIRNVDDEIRAAFLDRSDVRTQSFSQLLAEVLANEQLGVRLFGWLGVASGVLGMIGIYGLTTLNAINRRHEMAVRAALGAARLHLRWLCIARIVVTIMAGTGAGVLAATGLSRTAQASIVGLGGIGTSSYVIAAVVALAGGVGAAIVGSRSIHRINIHRTLTDSP